MVKASPGSRASRLPSGPTERGCGRCGTPVGAYDPLCDACLQAATSHGPACERCGTLLKTDNSVCDACLEILAYRSRLRAIADRRFPPLPGQPARPGRRQGRRRYRNSGRDFVWEVGEFYEAELPIWKPFVREWKKLQRLAPLDLWYRFRSKWRSRYPFLTAAKWERYFSWLVWAPLLLRECGLLPLPEPILGDEDMDLEEDDLSDHPLQETTRPERSRPARKVDEGPTPYYAAGNPQLIARYPPEVLVKLLTLRARDIVEWLCHEKFGLTISSIRAYVKQYRRRRRAAQAPATFTDLKTKKAR